MEVKEKSIFLVDLEYVSLYDLYLDYDLFFEGEFQVLGWMGELGDIGNSSEMLQLILVYEKLVILFLWEVKVGLFFVKFLFVIDMWLEFGVEMEVE